MSAPELTVNAPTEQPTGCALLGCGREVRTLHCECVHELPDDLRNEFRRAFWAWDMTPKGGPAWFVAFRRYQDAVNQAKAYLRRRVLGQPEAREPAQAGLPL